MRKFLVSLAPATLAVAVLVACEADSDPGGGGISFDAGVTDGANDGLLVDAATDAVPDAPVVPTVNVTVSGLGGPKANVRIVFHAADGRVIETKVTDADGKATHVGSDATMVSALLAGGGQRQIVTWTGVEAGDDLQLRDTLPDEAEDIRGQYNVILTSDFVDAGVAAYWVDGPCGGAPKLGTATGIPVFRRCSHAKNAVLVTASGNDNIPRGHAFQKGIDNISDGSTGVVMIDGWKAPASFGLTVANAPPDPDLDSDLLEIADGHGFHNNTGTSNDGSTIDYKTASGFADAYQATVRKGTGSRRKGLTTRVAAPATSIAFDHAMFLPTIDSSSIDTTNPRRPVVQWTSDEPTSGADGGIVQFRFNGPDDVSYAWTLVVPPGATKVTTPAMPPEAEAFLPYAADAGTESTFSQPEVLFVEASTIPSYALFRGQQGTLLDYLGDVLPNESLPAMPLDGVYRWTSFSPVPR